MAHYLSVLTQTAHHPPPAFKAAAGTQSHSGIKGTAVHQYIRQAKKTIKSFLKQRRPTFAGSSAAERSSCFLSSSQVKQCVPRRFSVMWFLRKEFPQQQQASLHWKCICWKIIEFTLTQWQDRGKIEAKSNTRGGLCFNQFCIKSHDSKTGQWENKLCVWNRWPTFPVVLSGC